MEPASAELSLTFTAKPRSTSEMVRRVAAYFRPYKWIVVGNILCILLALASSLVFPQIIQYIIDDVIRRGAPSLLLPAILALLAAFLLRDLFTSLRIIINSSLKLDVLRDIRCDIYARLQRLPVDYFDRRASGDLMTRLIDDANVLESVLVDGAEQGAVAVLSIVVVCVILFTKNPYLALLAFIPIPLLVTGIFWYSSAAVRRYRLLRLAFSALNTPLADNIQGIRQIKAFNGESYESERFAKSANALRQRALDVFKAWAVYSPAMAFAGSLGMALVLWGGGKMVVDGRITIGELVGFLFYLTLFYQPLGGLHNLNQNLQAARSAGERIFDILDAAPERRDARGNAAFATPVRGDVRYEDVSFGYESGRDAIENVSLHALPGQMIALVGQTGSGKSTLVSLLTRFYEASSGRITIDSVDIANVSLEELRTQVALVTQETFLFNSTVRDNLLYGKRDASEEELLAASVAANCHEFIERMPQGYETLVGERGVKLSVGEKQRISIARALLKNAPILILDEATASVDALTETLIQEALRRLMKHRTSFVIAHRLSTIRNADQILVFWGGAIAERGPHEQLLALDGIYAKLWRSRTIDTAD
ncbi:MAG: ABC transporter ATP-binding protein [Methylocystis sp.]|nr:ABC transporter ATP-binding protein [Methylocystis sp.]